jgi:hypothetical protein
LSEGGEEVAEGDVRMSGGGTDRGAKEAEKYIGGKGLKTNL